MPRKKGDVDLPIAIVIQVSANASIEEHQDLLSHYASQRYVLTHTYNNDTRWVFYKNYHKN